jgi:hypothetical protein
LTHYRSIVVAGANPLAEIVPCEIISSVGDSHLAVRVSYDDTPRVCPSSEVHETRERAREYAAGVLAGARDKTLADVASRYDNQLAHIQGA